MLIHNADITGSLLVNGTRFNTGSFSGSFTGIVAGTTATASYVEYNSVANKPALVSGSSQITYSGLTGIPSGIVSGSSQVAALGFATTGSNTFQANQTITGSLFITQNLVVAGSSSIQYISSSVLDIADNIITVNAFNPGVRFGGLAVIDSGSSPQVSGSILFDSIKDQWIFVHQNQAVVTSSVLLMGPEVYNNIGNETYLSANRLPKGSGIEHLRDSNISDTGTVVSVNSNTQVTGSFTVVSGSAVELQVTNTGVNIGNALTDSHIISGSLRINPNGLFVSGSGNVGIGVTPSAWVDYKVLQLGGGSISSYVDNTYFEVSQNAFWNSSYKYVNNGFASRYQQYSGGHEWHVAPSGTAGNAISFTQAMTLNASGNLVLGNISVTNSAGYTRIFNVYDSTSAAIGISIASNDYQLGVESDGGFRVRYNGSSRLTLSSTGAVTLAGALNGTSASFSGNVAAQGFQMNGTGGYGVLAKADGNNSAANGAYIGFVNNANSRYFISQLDTNNDINYYYFNGSTWSSSLIKFTNTGAATFTNSITSNYTYNGGGVGMLHLTSNGTEGGSITFEKTSGTAQKYKIGNNGAAFFVYDETGAKQPFTILNNGNVGIGTTSPVAALNVSNVPTSYFGIIETTGTSAGTVKHFRVHKPGYVEYGIGILANNSFHISTASTFPTTNGFTITSTGNVGMGTDNPLTRLDCQTANTGTVLVTAAFRDSSTNGNALQIWNGNNEARFRAVYYGAVASDQNITFYTIQSSGVEAERMRINSAGLVTKPFQTSFKAGRNSSYSPGANSNIIFNDTSSANFHFNIGNNYNTSNGVYTAPVAGRYVFTTCVIYEGVSEGQAMDDAFEIYINNVSAIYSFRRAEYVAGTTGNGGYYTDHATVIFNLSAGDFVTVRNQRNIMIHGNSKYCWFTGYLLG